jgi:demethylmenaquinone methyltransferase/2-methoxy-6-polyprenyl-1,4-benzoquinol methylase
MPLLNVIEGLGLYRYKEKTSASVQHLFDRISPGYDLFNHLVSFFLDGYWRRRTVAEVDPQARQVLDVCTGTGELVFAAQRRLSNGAQVIGTDFSGKMLRRALLKRDHQAFRKRPQFCLGDAQNLSFPDDTFDAVTSGFSIRNLTDMERGLREMHRVLRPGGRAIILEINRPSRGVGGFFYGLYLRTWVPLIGALTCRSLSPFTYLKESVVSFLTPENFCRTLERVGFRSASYRSLPPGAIGLYVATK